MADREKWSISEVKTVEGETMIVGGESYEFGLIAAVTNEADARQIIADRESHDALVKALEDARRDMLALRPRSDTGSLRARQIEASAAKIAAALALCDKHDKTGGDR